MKVISNIPIRSKSNDKINKHCYKKKKTVKSKIYTSSAFQIDCSRLSVSTVKRNRKKGREEEKSPSLPAFFLSLAPAYFFFTNGEPGTGYISKKDKQLKMLTPKT